MKWNSNVFAVLLLCVVSFLSIRIYQVEYALQGYKNDAIELSKIKYGLFSVDEWKRILSSIISKKVNEFNFDNSNKDELRRQISKFLYKEIAEIERRFNRDASKSLLGIIRSGVASITGTFGAFKEQVPAVTESIISFMDDPSNRKAIGEYINSKLDNYAKKTFAEIDYSEFNRIVSKYKLNDKNSTIKVLKESTDKLKAESQSLIVWMLICVALLATLLTTTSLPYNSLYLLVIMTCGVLLVNGLLLPMIEIDARIDSMKFNLLGEPVNFVDQVLYYKSKSILEVVRMMFAGTRLDMIFVGVLVLLFSVLFPVSKLVATIVYTFDESRRGNRFINFMVFKTGKWSMADVMVVAIFMAYIGFSGIITEQLKQIEGIALNVDILTTNKSSLQAGFFSFTSFSVLSLLVSHKLQYAAGRHPKLR
jgi:hypothetical protein